jgi:hypothetical protein
MNPSNSFSYRVYYAYYGATKCDPFRSEKNDEQISIALRNFQQDLTHYLSDDPDSRVTSKNSAQDANSIEVVVNTNLSKEATNASVKNCLNALDLFAEIVP